MSSAVLSVSCGAQKDKVYVGELDTIGLPIYSLSLLDHIYFGGRQLKVTNLLVEEAVWFSSLDLNRTPVPIFWWLVMVSLFSLSEVYPLQSLTYVIESILSKISLLSLAPLSLCSQLLLDIYNFLLTYNLPLT